jgi:hypothetical protein
MHLPGVSKDLNLIPSTRKQKKRRRKQERERGRREAERREREREREMDLIFLETPFCCRTHVDSCYYSWSLLSARVF